MKSKDRPRTETVLRGELDEVCTLLDEAMTKAVARGYSPGLWALAALNYSVCALQTQVGTGPTVEQMRALIEHLQLNDAEPVGRC